MEIQPTGETVEQAWKRYDRDARREWLRVNKITVHARRDGKDVGCVIETGTDYWAELGSLMGL